MNERNIKIHEVKLNAKYCEAVLCNKKTFELRLNDRDYRVGDWLVMGEWDGTKFTGREIIREIVYILPLDEFGMPNWVVMSIR